MTKTKVWSEGRNEFVSVTTTKKQDAAIAAFIEENKSGEEFFDAHEWHSLFTEKQNEAVDTGTASFAYAFLPEGLGVVQHGHDSFAIEE